MRPTVFTAPRLVASNTGGNVTAFVGSNGNEQVGLSRSHLFQSFYGSRGGVNGHQVEVGTERAHPFLVVVY